MIINKVCMSGTCINDYDLMIVSVAKLKTIYNSTVGGLTNAKNPFFISNTMKKIVFSNTPMVPLGEWYYKIQNFT